jgi:hypothetical protein
MAKKVQLEVEIKGNDSVAQASEKTKALKENIEKLKETLASGGLGEKEYQKANDQLQKYEERLKKTENTTKSMTSELRSLTQLIASGKLKGEELINAQMAAGKLKDAIADAKQEVNNFASDTRKLDAFLELGSGIAGGFAAAQGAMALFGSENEDLQKSLVKIQSSVAVLNGVQAVANSLNKSSALITELQAVKSKVLTFVETQRAAAVEAGGNAMQRAAVKARMFGLALGALGIGALIAGIIYLIANFDKLTAAFDKTTMSQKALKETQEAYTNAAKDAQSEVNKMASTFNLAKKGLVDKQKALLEYNEKFGKTLGIAKDYNQAEKIFADKSAAYVKAMALRAQANALYEKSAESAVKQIDALNEDNISNTDKLLLGIKTSIFGVRNTIDEVAKAQIEGTDEIVNQEKKKQKAYQDTADALMQTTLELENQNKIDLSGVEDKDANKKAEDAKKLFEANKKAALQRAKDAQKDLIKKFDDEQKAIKDDKQAKLDIEDEYQDALLDKEIEARKKLNEEKEKLDEEHLEKVKEYKAMEAQTEVDLQDAKIQAVQVGAQILGQFAGQSKALALTALAIEKGAAIAGVIINASRELSANALTASLNPLNATTGGAAGAIQLAKSNALTKIRAGISIASISAAGISGAKNITSGGSGGVGGSVQPPNIRGSQTTNEPTSQPATKVFVTETDIRSVTRKVDGIFTQATIQ